MENRTDSEFDKQIDAAIDAAVDRAAELEERQMAMAIWRMMNTRKGRRKPHRSFLLQELPEVALKLQAQRRNKKKLAKRARAVTYRNCR